MWLGFVDKKDRLLGCIVSYQPLVSHFYVYFLFSFFFFFFFFFFRLYYILFYFIMYIFCFHFCFLFFFFFFFHLYFILFYYVYFLFSFLFSFFICYIYMFFFSALLFFFFFHNIFSGHLLLHVWSLSKQLCISGHSSIKNAHATCLREQQKFWLRGCVGSTESSLCINFKKYKFSCRGITKTINIHQYKRYAARLLITVPVHEIMAFSVLC